MSDGQKAHADDMREEAFNDHVHRLQKLGFQQIATTSEDLIEALSRFENDVPSLSRTCWMRLDKIKELASKLR
jgi:hypothetical protein